MKNEATPTAKKRYPRRNLDQRFDCFDEGCEECEVCKYRNFTDWAESVCGSDGTIERNTRIESYLKGKADSIQQAEKWAEKEMMKKVLGVVEKTMTSWECVTDIDNPVSIVALKKDILKDLSSLPTL